MTAKTVYSGTTHNVGGANGSTRAADGLFDFQLADPHPAAENFFGAAWSGCFMGAIGLAAAQKKVALPEAPSIDATIDLLMEGTEFFLRAKLDVTVPGIDIERGPRAGRYRPRDLPLFEGDPRQYRRRDQCARAGLRIKLATGRTAPIWAPSAPLSI